MLCDECHENEAVISITQITNKGRTEMHLCSSCAAKHTELTDGFAPFAGTNFLTNLLASVLGITGGDKDEEDNIRKTNVVCPSCGMSYNELIKYGTFGCPDCYRTFNFLLDGYLKKIQGNCVHTGKKPVHSEETVHMPSVNIENEENSGSDIIAITVDERSTEEELKAALRRAVAREEYEEAARIRDIIRAGEGKVTNA